MESHPQPHHATIAVITALPKEYAAVKVVLGVQHEMPLSERGPLRSIALSTVLAKSGGSHTVAVVLLTEMGNNPAAVWTATLIQKCKNLKHIIMTGIAGAVPHPTKPDQHVRLGDIVVSRTGVFQYDLTKVSSRIHTWPQNRFLRFIWWLMGWEVQRTLDEKEYRAPERPPCPVLLEAVRMLEVDAELNRRPWESTIDQFVEEYGSDWDRPPGPTDRLCDGPDELPTPHPLDPKRHSPQYPRVFHGRIGSANTLLKDPVMRDLLRDRFHVLAIEMEGSGVADATWSAQIGYLVIRGTCDYCNKDKNDVWQKYAALVAAAFTKAVIEAVPADTTPLVDAALYEAVAAYFRGGGSTLVPDAQQLPFQSEPSERSENTRHQERASGQFDKDSLKADVSVEIDKTPVAGPATLPTAELAQFSLEHLLGAVDALRAELDDEQAFQHAPAIEQLLSDHEMVLPRSHLRRGYLTLAELHLADAERRQRPGQPIDTTRAEHFYHKAQKYDADSA